MMIQLGKAEVESSKLKSMAPTSTGFVHSIPKLASVSRLKLRPAFQRPVSCPTPLVTVRFLCNCGLQERALDMSAYKERFSKRMAMAGLKPHNRIALGVSGGPDSMGLCVLAADWKKTGSDSAAKTDGFIHGILAIVVDHGLRTESGEEAKTVQKRVSNMDVRLPVVNGPMGGQNKGTCKKRPGK